jgi:hypothetical protein
MKKIKRPILLFLILMSLATCKKDDPYPKVPLLCPWPEGNYSGETVKNYITEVVLSEVALTQYDSVYVIRMPEKIGKLSSGYLLPCNIPDEAKENGLKISISGHIVRFKNFDSALLVYGYPFEITSIKYLDK